MRSFAGLVIVRCSKSVASFRLVEPISGFDRWSLGCCCPFGRAAWSDGAFRGGLVIGCVRSLWLQTQPNFHCIGAPRVRAAVLAVLTEAALRLWLRAAPRGTLTRFAWAEGGVVECAMGTRTVEARDLSQPREFISHRESSRRRNRLGCPTRCVNTHGGSNGGIGYTSL
ncbi:MAG: hypothetical protein ACI9OJ_000116 [Myxococcota bacterium]|jgi:hypothetical protein